MWATPEIHCEQTAKCGKDQSEGWKRKKAEGDEKLVEGFESRDIRIQENQPADHSTEKREKIFVNNLTPKTPEGVSVSIGNKLFSSEIWGEVTYKLFAPEAEIIKKGQQGQQMGEYNRGKSLRETVKGVADKEGGVKRGDCI